MMVKTAILCVPAYDEAAVDVVRRLLTDHMSVAMLFDRAAPMQRNLLEETLCRWADEDELDLIVTVGGTLPAPGPGGRELVPDATLAVAERLLPGLAEAMRALAQEAAPLAILDRSVAAIRGRTLILNLPAGAGAAALFLGSVVDVLPTVVALLQDAQPDLHIVEDDEVTATPESPSSAPPSAGGKQPLDPAEFAAFLARKQ